MPDITQFKLNKIVYSLKTTTRLTLHRDVASGLMEPVERIQCTCSVSRLEKVGAEWCLASCTSLARVARPAGWSYGAGRGTRLIWYPGNPESCLRYVTTTDVIFWFRFKEHETNNIVIDLEVFGAYNLSTQPVNRTLEKTL